MNYKVAHRYAKGLFDFTEKSNESTALYSEMKFLLSLLNESTDLKRFFKSPVVDYRKKQTIVKEIFKANSSTFNKFVNLVIQQGRESNLTEIANQFVNLVDDKNEVQKATILSATKLEKSLIDLILKESKFIDNSKPIQITEIIDENLIGGYILRIGDKQIDASIKTKLNKIRGEFDENEYIAKI